jgi:hypothetical protein
MNKIFSYRRTCSKTCTNNLTKNLLNPSMIIDYVAAGAAGHDG